MPLEGYATFVFFKIYLLDVGLLGAISHLSPKLLVEGNSLFQEFKGSLIENYVANELIRTNYSLYYWSSSGKAELDFLVQHNDLIYPIEVKSGNSGKKKSLLIYKEKHHPKVLIRTSPMNLRKDGNILNCSLYLLNRLGVFLDQILSST